VFLAIWPGVALAAGQAPSTSPETTQRPEKTYTQNALETRVEEVWTTGTGKWRLAPSGESGGGQTWVEVLRRITAAVEGLDFEESAASLKLLWNITPKWNASVELFPETSLYEPLQQDVSDDPELLDSLSDEAARQDDFLFTVRFIPNDDDDKGKVLGRAAGFRVVEQGFDTATRQLLWKRPALRGLSFESMFNRKQLSEVQASYVTALYRRTADAIINAPEWDYRAFYRSRGELVGPDEWGIRIARAVALGSPRRKVRKRFASLVEDLKILQKPLDDRTNAQSTRAAKLERYDGAAPQHRLLAKLEYSQREDYDIAAPVDFSKDGASALVAQLAYSLLLPGDSEGPSIAPRYEFQLQYEDVDEDTERHDRFVGRAVLTKAMDFLGQSTEVTIGLIASNKPEYVAAQESDFQLGANLALAFKMGNLNPKPNATTNE
jgi:hypothetical protein